MTRRDSNLDAQALEVGMVVRRAHRGAAGMPAPQRVEELAGRVYSYGVPEVLVRFAGDETFQHLDPATPFVLLYRSTVRAAPAATTEESTS